MWTLWHMDGTCFLLKHLFRYLLRLRRYKRKSVEVGGFRSGLGHFERKLQTEGASPTNHCWCQNSKVIALLCDMKISAVHYLVLSQSTRVTDRQTDRITTPKTALDGHSIGHIQFRVSLPLQLCLAVRRQWVVELLFVYKTSVFTHYTILYYSSILLLFYYNSTLYCSYTTQSFIRFANINVKWKLIYNISSCHTLIRWKTKTNLYLNVYVLSGTILQSLSCTV